MTIIGVSVNNVAQLQAELKDLKLEITEKVYTKLVEMARVEIETPAKLKTPVVTGRLRASIITLTAEQSQYKYVVNKSKGTAYFENVDSASGSDVYDGSLKTIKPKKYDILVGTNVEYAEKIEKKRSYLQSSFDNAVPKMISEVQKIKGMKK